MRQTGVAVMSSKLALSTDWPGWAHPSSARPLHCNYKQEKRNWKLAEKCEPVGVFQSELILFSKFCYNAQLGLLSKKCLLNFNFSLSNNKNLKKILFYMMVLKITALSRQFISIIFNLKNIHHFLSPSMDSLHSESQTKRVIGNTRRN